MKKAIIETRLHTYSFDISKAEEKQQYRDLCAKLRGMGLKVFDTIAGWSKDANDYDHTIKSLNGQIVKLETDHLFKNQWNTSVIPGGEHGLRIFDWSENIYPNKNIKWGYWIEQTEEMTSIRRDTHACGYCGTQYYLPKQKVCLECLGSEYLSDENLVLLELVPIDESIKRSNAVPQDLRDAYVTRRRIERTKRLNAAKMRALEKLEEDKKANEIEYLGKSMLIKNDFDPENVIYYSHSKTFCFGWRNALEETIAYSLREKLAEMNFPYKFEIKVA